VAWVDHLHGHWRQHHLLQQIKTRQGGQREKENSDNCTMRRLVNTLLHALSQKNLHEKVLSILDYYARTNDLVIWQEMLGYWYICQYTHGLVVYNNNYMFPFRLETTF